MSALLLVAACGSSSKSSKAASSPTTTAVSPGSNGQLDSLIAAAKKEGSVEFYTNASEAIAKPSAAAFQKAYGIATSYVRLSSGELETRYSTEAASKVTNADVLVHSNVFFFHDNVVKGVITPLNGAGLPGGFPNGTFPAKYVINNGETAGVALTPYGMAYNTSLLKSGPKVWTDLLNSQYTGKLVGQNPVLQGQSEYEFWDFIDQTYGDDYLTKFKAQHPRWVVGSPAGAQSVASGDSSAAIQAVDQIVLPVKNAGAPIAFVPTTPTTFGEQYVGVSAHAAHPNAARLFASWLLSSEGNHVWNAIPGNTSPYDAATGAGFIAPRSSEAAKPDVRAKLAHLLGLQ